jgi:hypothetical protein
MSSDIEDEVYERLYGRPSAGKGSAARPAAEHPSKGIVPPPPPLPSPPPARPRRDDPEAARSGPRRRLVPRPRGVDRGRQQRRPRAQATQGTCRGDLFTRGERCGSDHGARTPAPPSREASTGGHRGPAACARTRSAAGPARQAPPPQASQHSPARFGTAPARAAASRAGAATAPPHHDHHAGSARHSTPGKSADDHHHDSHDHDPRAGPDAQRGDEPRPLIPGR